MEEKFLKPIISRFGLFLRGLEAEINNALYIFSYFLLIKERENSIWAYNSRLLLINDKTKLGTFSNFHHKKTKFFINAFSRK